MRRLLPLFAAGVALTVLVPASLSQGPVRNFVKSRFGAPAVPLAACDSTTGQCFPVGSTPASAVPQPMAAPDARPLGALYYDLVRIRVAHGLEKAGYKGDAHSAARSITNAVIDGQMTALKVPAGAGGTIISAIIAFLGSPAGQALIAALIQLILHGGG